MIERELLTVRVSRRVLWIGSQAYPLHNIARFRTLAEVPDTRGMWLTFTRNAVLSTVVGVVLAMLAMAYGDEFTNGLLMVILGMVGLVVIVSLYQLASGLRTPTYYMLFIETNGDPSAVLRTVNYWQIADLVDNLADAIDNRAAEFAMQIENLQIGDHYGDNISQRGARNFVGPR